jgi:DNA-binding CsgD family transcriptional regulator
MTQVSSDYHFLELDTLDLGSTVPGANSIPGPTAVRTGALTSREASVLALIVQGSTNRETAKVLGISPRTVEFHRANIMQKTAAKNLADLMRLLFSGSIHTS